MTVDWAEIASGLVQGEVVVTTVYPGAAPGEVESQVTKKLEDEISTLANLQDLVSYSRESLSQIIVMFRLETDQDMVAIDVKDKVEAIRAQLPEGAQDPVITKFDIVSFAAVDLAVSGPRPLPELHRIVDQQIQDRLSRVDGVAAVQIVGGQEREIRLAVAPERLRPYGLSLLDVLGVLAAGNLNVPVGHITSGDGEFNVRLRGEVTEPEELGRIRVPLRNGTTIPLSEVAEIQDTAAELRQRSSYNGQPVISLAVLSRRQDSA